MEDLVLKLYEVAPGLFLTILAGVAYYFIMKNRDDKAMSLADRAYDRVKHLEQRVETLERQLQERQTTLYNLEERAIYYERFSKWTADYALLVSSELERAGYRPPPPQYPPPAEPESVKTRRAALARGKARASEFSSSQEAGPFSAPIR